MVKSKISIIIVELFTRNNFELGLTIDDQNVVCD